MPKPAHRKEGFIKKEVKEFAEEVVQIDRVTRVVKGGRKLRFRATVVVGNHKGKVGMGIGKSNEVTGAIQKAVSKGKKHLLNIIMDGTTIPHRIQVKYKAAKLLLIPAVEGTGLMAGSAVRKVLELAGIKDIMSKCLGASNKVNNTKAAVLALKMLSANPFMIRKAKIAALKRAEVSKPQAKAAQEKTSELKKKAAEKEQKTTEPNAIKAKVEPQPETNN